MARRRSTHRRRSTRKRHTRRHRGGGYGGWPSVPSSQPKPAQPKPAPAPAPAPLDPSKWGKFGGPGR